MQHHQTQILIIGAGTSGLNAVREATNAGADWLLVEADQYGTTCARVGCMPSKLLIAAAEVARTVHEADEFGIRTGAVEIDVAAVFERVRRYRDEFVQGVVDDTLELPESRRLMGAARFLSPGVLEIGGEHRVEAERVVIAVGGEPFVPSVFDTVKDRLLTSDSVFEIDSLPDTIAVVGAGAIGLELGQALSHLGVKVSLFDRGGELGIASDPEIQAAAKDLFGHSLDSQLNTNITRCDPVDQGLELTWSDSNGQQCKRHFGGLLIAAGRRPNLDDLELEKAGLKLNDRGQPEWDPRTTQCADQPVFLAGDANGHRAVLHEASDEGRIAGQNAVAWPDVVAHVRRTPLGIVFCDPQMAIAGSSYEELDLDQVEIGDVSYARQGRARVIDRAEGLVRFYADRSSCVLLGAELLCPRAENLAHALAWAIDQKLTVQQLLQMPFYHPVLEEGLRTGLRRLAKNLKVAGATRCEDQAVASGM